MSKYKFNPYLFPAFFFVLLLSVSSAFAQKVWTLEDCINYAFENNIQIKQSKLQVQSVQADLLQSKLDFIPSINGYSSANYSWGRSLDSSNVYRKQNTFGSSLGVRSDVTLFGGLQKHNILKQNELSYAASQYDSEKMENDIALSLTAAYLNILFNHEMLLVAQSQADITKQQISRTKELVDAGTLPQGDLLEIQAQGMTEEVNVIKADNNLSLSYLDLLQMLDLPANEEFEIEQPNIEISGDIDIYPSEQVYANAVTFMPEIKSAELNVLSAQRGVKIAKGAIYPSVSISGGIGSNYYNLMPVSTAFATFGKQLQDNLNEYITLSLSVPIFNSYQTTTRVRKAKIQSLNSKFNLDLAKNSLRKNIEQKYFDAIAAYKTYNANKASVKSLEEAFKYTEEKFNLGMVNSLDYNQAKSKLTQAQSELLRAKYDYIFKTKILDFYMGIPLKF